MSNPEGQSIPEELVSWAENHEIDPRNKALFRSINAEIVGHVLSSRLAKGSNILEIGSGTGELSELIPDEYKTNYNQLDLRPQYTQINRLAHPEASLVLADAKQMPVADKSEDAVVAMDVLDIVDDLEALVAEIKRILKPGGKVIHFHERMPNMTFLYRHTPEDVIAFPLVSEGKMGAFQYVNRDEYDRKKSKVGDLFRPIDSYKERIPSSPETLLQARGFAPQIVDAQSEIVQEHFPNAKKQSFMDLFDEVMKSAFESSGFEVEFERPDGHAAVPIEIVRNAHPNFYGEGLDWDANGGYRFIGKPDELPPEVDVHAVLPTLIATKEA